MLPAKWWVTRGPAPVAITQEISFSAGRPAWWRPGMPGPDG